jgi:hypothetical protein
MKAAGETENLFLEIEKCSLEGDLNPGFAQGRFPNPRCWKISVSTHVSKNAFSVSSFPQENHGNGFWETPCRFPKAIGRFPEKVYYRRKPRICFANPKAASMPFLGFSFPTVTGRVREGPFRCGLEPGF